MTSLKLQPCSSPLVCSPNVNDLTLDAFGELLFGIFTVLAMYEAVATP